MDFGTLNFSFMLRTDMRFGAGEIGKLPEHLRGFGWKRIGLVIDAGASKHSAWRVVQGELEQDCEIVARLETAVTEPTYDYLDRVRGPFMHQPIDGLVVMGGGSVLDLGKGLSILATNTEPALTYRGFPKLERAALPVVAIPTTAGTASEVTPSAVFISVSDRRKFGINTDMYIPKLCILDPVLTTSCPRSVTVSSGMDAVVHAHESFVSKRATPITRLFSLEGFRLVVNALTRVVDDPENLDLRGRVQLGSYLAGAALFNSSAGPAGAMSYPLGVHQNVPHGLAGAVFLPRVIQHNVDRGYTAYAPLYELIDGADPTADPADASRRFAAYMWTLCDTLGVPRTLESFGFTRAGIDGFAEQAQLLRAAFDNNPIPFTPADVRATLEAMTPA